MSWNYRELQELVKTGAVERVHDPATVRRAPYPVVEVEPSGPEQWPSFYRLKEGVDPTAITSLEELEEASDLVYNYYAWVCGAKAVSVVVKTMGAEELGIKN